MRISPWGSRMTTWPPCWQGRRVYRRHSQPPEGIKGGQSVAAAIYLARTGQSKTDIKQYVETQFGYDLSRHVDEIRPTYQFNESSQETVPQAIRAFLDSTDFEDAIRTAISLGGDSDTLACITGGIAQAFYGGVPDDIQQKVYSILDENSGESSQKLRLRAEIAPSCAASFAQGRRAFELFNPTHMLCRWERLRTNLPPETAGRSTVPALQPRMWPWLPSGAVCRALFRLEGSVQNISHFGLRLILVQGMICSFFPSPGEFPRGKISSIRWRAPSNFPDASCSCRFSCPSGNRQCVSAERLPIARRRSRRGRHQLRGSDDEFRG